MDLAELLRLAFVDHEVDALGIVWAGVSSTVLAAVRTWEWVRSRSPVTARVVPTPLLDSDGDGLVVIHNRSPESVYVWRIFVVGDDGKESDVVGNAESAEFEVGSRRRMRFRVPHGERTFRKSRRMVIELSTGRSVVLGRRVLYAATSLHGFERCHPHWRTRRVKFWLDKHLPGATRRGKRRDDELRAGVRARFFDHLDRHRPTAPWPRHPAAQDILQMVIAEHESDSDYRPFSEMCSELQAAYEERRARLPLVVQPRRPTVEHIRLEGRRPDGPPPVPPDDSQS